MDASEGQNTLPDISCYIHDVSPVKKAQSTERRYFNLSLQTKNESVRALCFLPEKQAELKTLEQVKSPVKIKNYQKPHKDIFLNQFTKITAIPSDEIDFVYSEIFNDDGIISNISSLQKVAGEEVVSLKAEIAHLSGVKYLDTLHHGKLKKQEAIVRDGSSSIKLILWEDYVESLELKKTYLLKNLCMKVTKKERYLNTAKTEEFISTEVEPFQHPLVEVDQDLSLVSSTTWNARILGIQQALKNFLCMSCSKNVTKCPNGVLGKCTSCKISQVMSSCPVQWFLKVLVQNVDKAQQKQRLTLYHNDVKQLIDKLGIILDLNTASEDDILLEILQVQKTISITFDTITYKVTNIEL